MIDKKYTERFWKKVDIRDNKDECWEWRGATRGKNKSGYGKIVIEGTHKLAHRLAYEFAFDTAPDNLNVCHKCDNTKCCNPKHLFLGTQKDNVKDCIKKGRFASHVGDKNPNASLTELEVSHIKGMLKVGIKTKKIYKMYPNITYNQLQYIKTNKSWKHVK